jgi:hypothetical protein
MSVFEPSVYSPTIEDIWKKSGISWLKSTELSIKNGGAVRVRGLQRRQVPVLTSGKRQKPVAANKVQTVLRPPISGTAFDEKAQFINC